MKTGIDITDFNGKSAFDSFQTHNSVNRYYLYADSRWVTSSDDNYGLNIENATESGGLGVNPIYEWEHQGYYIRKNTILKNVHFTGRWNGAVDNEDVEIVLVTKRPILESGWETGIDNDNEVIVDEIWRGQFLQSEAVNDLSNAPEADMLRKIINFDNYVMPGDGFFSVYVKPLRSVEAGTDTRFFYGQYSLLVNHRDIQVDY